MWEDLVSSAIVGTANSPPAVNANSPALAALLRGVDPADAEGLLLTCAGAMSTWRAAGKCPEKTDKPLGEPSPVDMNPMLGRRASHYLRLVLQVEYEGILSEFLGAIAAKGKRVSPEFLPSLMDISCSRPEVLRVLRTIQGNRGDWLARLQPKWLGAATVSEDAWETGDKPERIELLSSLRQTDPACARALLESTWKDESPKDRADFLKAISANATQDDEPFLERALLDKIAEVRRQATVLLLSLPQSRLHRQIREIAFSIVNVKKRMIGKAKLEVAIADDLADRLKQTRADFAPLPPNGCFRSFGDKARLVYTIVASIPPAQWIGRLSITAADFLGLIRDSDWDLAIFGGLCAAAERFPDPEFNEALLHRYLARWEERATLPPVAPGILGALSNQKAEALIADSLMTSLTVFDHPGLWLLSEYNRTWSASLTAKVAQMLKRCTAQGEASLTAVSQLAAALSKCILFIPTPSVDEICKALGSLPKTPAMDKQLDRLQSILIIRRDMLPAIESED